MTATVLVVTGLLLAMAAVALLLRRKPGKHAAPQTPAPEPMTETPPVITVPAAAPVTTVAGPDALHRVYALALNDPRAADAAAVPDPAHMALLAAASQEIEQIGTAPRYTPRQPSLLPQLLEAIEDENVSLRAMARIVSQDPRLTGDLLRSANSALYRTSGAPIESVERAAAHLGTHGIRMIIAGSLMQPLATGTEQNAGFFGEMMWEHSIYSASAAEALTARTQNEDAFAAHLVGLMHGLGTVAIFRVVTDLYAAQTALQPDAVAIAQALTTHSAATAKRIAASWGLSARTQEALEAQSPAAPAVDMSPLGQALRFGLLAGAIVLLCRHQQMQESAGLTMLVDAGYRGVHYDRVWERMLRAYVRP